MKRLLPKFKSFAAVLLTASALSGAAFAGIRALESLAQAGTDSPVARYVGLANDVTPLIDLVDTATSSASCSSRTRYASSGN